MWVTAACRFSNLETRERPLLLQKSIHLNEKVVLHACGMACLYPWNLGSLHRRVESLGPAWATYWDLVSKRKQKEQGRKRGSGGGEGKERKGLLSSESSSHKLMIANHCKWCQSLRKGQEHEREMKVGDLKTEKQRGLCLTPPTSWNRLVLPYFTSTSN